MSELLNRVYASAPTDEVLIQTLEIKTADPIRICTGFENHTLTLETGESVEFIAGPLEISEPKRDTSGQQTLTFKIADVTGEGQKAVEAALETGEKVQIVYRVYLASDKTAPAAVPAELVLTGGGFEGMMLGIEASYYDLLNTAWPRTRYTADFAPGLRYI